MNKIIKASQYDQSFSVNQTNGNEYTVASDTSENSKMQEQNMLDKAFKKAKQIVDSAQEYNLRQKQEADSNIEHEFSEAKKNGHDEGFARGLEEGKKAGLSTGKSKGYDDGLKRAAAENRKNLDELALMIESVEKEKTRILQKFESDLENLAFDIAQAILKNELKTNSNTMRSIIQNAMDSYRNQEWLRIYVSDNTASVLLKGDKNIINTLKNVSENIKVISNPKMNDGDCILEMPDQVIDAGVDSQLKKFKTAIDSEVVKEQK